jgi:hypothetical protein
VQRDDSDGSGNSPTPRRAGVARLLAIALITWGAFSIVNSAMDIVHRALPLLVAAAVLALAVMSRAKRKP